MVNINKIKKAKYDLVGSVWPIFFVFCLLLNSTIGVGTADPLASSECNP